LVTAKQEATSGSSGGDSKPSKAQEDAQQESGAARSCTLLLHWMVATADFQLTNKWQVAIQAVQHVLHKVWGCC
jgi:hypothetical protein